MVIILKHEFERTSKLGVLKGFHQLATDIFQLFAGGCSLGSPCAREPSHALVVAAALVVVILVGFVW